MPVEVSLTSVETLSRERVSFSTSLVNSSLAVRCSRQRAWNTGGGGRDRGKKERERERERDHNPLPHPPPPPPPHTHVHHITDDITSCFSTKSSGIEVADPHLQKRKPFMQDSIVHELLCACHHFLRSKPGVCLLLTVTSILLWEHRAMNC